MTRSSTSSF